MAAASPCRPATGYSKPHAGRRRSGAQGLANFQVAVNLFGAQFRSGDFARKVLDVLQHTGLAAD